jgi:hypothetical protein
LRFPISDFSVTTPLDSVPRILRRYRDSARLAGAIVHAWLESSRSPHRDDRSVPQFRGPESPRSLSPPLLIVASVNEPLAAFVIKLQFTGDDRSGRTSEPFPNVALSST